MSRKKKYTYCCLCEAKFATEVKLEEHLFSLLHHRSLAAKFGAKYGHACILCSYKCQGLAAFVKHLQSESHKNNHTKRTKQLENTENAGNSLCNLEKYRNLFLCKPLKQVKKTTAIKRKFNTPVKSSGKLNFSGSVMKNWHDVSKQLSKHFSEYNPNRCDDNNGQYVNTDPSIEFSGLIKRTCFNHKNQASTFPEERLFRNVSGSYGARDNKYFLPRIPERQSFNGNNSLQERSKYKWNRLNKSFDNKRSCFSKSIAPTTLTNCVSSMNQITEVSSKKGIENKLSSDKLTESKNQASSMDHTQSEPTISDLKCEVKGTCKVVDNVNKSCTLSTTMETNLPRTSETIINVSTALKKPSSSTCNAENYLESKSGVVLSTITLQKLEKKKGVVKPNVLKARSRLISRPDKSSSDEGERVRRNAEVVKLFNARKNRAKNLKMVGGNTLTVSPGSKKPSGPRFGIGLAKNNETCHSIVLSEISDVDLPEEEELSAAILQHFSNDAKDDMKFNIEEKTTNFEQAIECGDVSKSENYPASQTQNTVKSKNESNMKKRSKSKYLKLTKSSREKSNFVKNVPRDKVLISAINLSHIKEEPVDVDMLSGGNQPILTETLFCNSIPVSITDIPVHGEKPDRVQSRVKTASISSVGISNHKLSLKPEEESQNISGSNTIQANVPLTDPTSSCPNKPISLLNVEDDTLRNIFAEFTSPIQTRPETTKLDPKVSLDDKSTSLLCFNQINQPVQMLTPKSFMSSQETMLVTQINNAQNDLDLIRNESTHIQALILQYNARQDFLKRREKMLKGNIVNMQQNLQQIQGQKLKNKNIHSNQLTAQPFHNLPDVLLNSKTTENTKIITDRSLFSSPPSTSKKGHMEKCSKFVKSEPIAEGYENSDNSFVLTKTTHIKRKSHLSATNFNEPIASFRHKKKIPELNIRSSSVEMSLSELNQCVHANHSYHTSAVVSVFVTKNNEIISCSKDKTLMIVDAVTGDILARHDLPNSPVKSCISFESDFSSTHTNVYRVFLVYAKFHAAPSTLMKSNVQQVKITINYQKEKCFGFTTTNLVHYDNSIVCLHYSKPVLYCGTRDGRVLVYNCLQHKMEDVFDCHSPHVVTCITSGADGARRVLCCGSSDCQVSVRDAVDGLLLRLFSGHTKTVNCVTLVQDLLYSGSMDRTILVHSISTGELLHRIIGLHSGGVKSFSLYKNSLASICSDKYFRVFESTDSPLNGLTKIINENPTELHLHSVCLRDQIIQGTTLSLAFIGCENGSLQVVVPSQLCDSSEKNDFSIFEEKNWTVEEVYCKLKQYHCKWTGCGETLTGLFSMNSHFYEVHATKDFLTNLESCCLWQDCTHYFSKDVDTVNDVRLHLQNHINNAIAKDSVVL